jgi:hypothetical protein
MKLDPVIKEVYRAKEQFAREIEDDVGKLFERLREDAKKHPERMANLQPPHKTSGRKRAGTKP